MSNIANIKEYKMKVAFIGLGAMGYPMAGHLTTSFKNVSVYNRTQAKAIKWSEQYKGVSAATPREAAIDADIVCLCVGNDDDVRSVVYGDDGVLASMKPKSLLIDHTTTSAQLARELASKCEQQDVHLLDAPVSGGEAGAQNGKLTIMIGGDEQTYESAIDVLDCYALKHQLMGPTGSGQLTKMVNQICIAGLLQGLSEAMTFAKNAQLDTDKVIDVIGKGAAQSWQMDNRAKTMVKDEFNFGFAVDWMIKDLGIVLEEAQANQTDLPVTKVVESFYQQVSANGGGRFDTSSLITLLK